MKIGFIGLGTMGGSMAYNALDGGNEMVVHDINPASAARNLEAGATWADTPKGVTEQSGIVFTSIPGPTEVKAVALGEAGIMEGRNRSWELSSRELTSGLIGYPMQHNIDFSWSWSPFHHRYPNAYRIPLTSCLKTRFCSNHLSLWMNDVRSS